MTRTAATLGDLAGSDGGQALYALEEEAKPGRGHRLGTCHGRALVIELKPSPILARRVPPASSAMTNHGQLE
jgi:hypothetical protein